MKTKWISVLIMLIAGAISSVIFLLQQLDATTMLLKLVIILPVFFILGKIMESVIIRLNMEVLNKEKEEAERIKQIVVETIMEEEKSVDQIKSLEE